MSEPKSFYFLSKSVPPELMGQGEKSVATRGKNSEESAEQGDVGETETYSASSWLYGMFNRSGYQMIREQKIRKVPTKVEPKVFFANERTFLAWLHMSVTLSTISVAIVAFAEANDFSQVYGLMLMPVAIAFCGYSLYMYMKRSSMIRQRHPGPCKCSYSMQK